MTREELAELRRIVEAMTPGEWLHGQRSWSHQDVSPGCCNSPSGRHEDAAGIVALRNAAPDLLAAVEECDRLRAELAAVRAAAVDACDGMIRHAADIDLGPGDDGSAAQPFFDLADSIRARIGGGP